MEAAQAAFEQERRTLHNEHQQIMRRANICINFDRSDSIKCVSI
jgi:hypothetical protein